MGIKRFTEYLAYDPILGKAFCIFISFISKILRLCGLHFIFDGVTVKTDAETVKYQGHPTRI